MNSEQKELLARASRMEPLEAIQSDIETAIVTDPDRQMKRKNYCGSLR